MSNLRVGVTGLGPEGELYAKSRFRVGVVGGTAADSEAMGRARVEGRWGGEVTSVWRMEVKMALACSVRGQQVSIRLQARRVSMNRLPLSASDSQGISLFLEGVDGPPSSMRW